MSAANRDFAAFVVVNHDGVGAVEIRNELPHAFDVDQIAAMGTEEKIGVQPGFQLSEGEAGQIGFLLGLGVDIIFIRIDKNYFLMPQKDGFSSLFHRYDFKGTSGHAL